MEAITAAGNETGNISTSLELRFLPPCIRTSLSRIMENNPGWRDIMAYVPGDPWKSGDPIPGGIQYPKKYTWEDIITVTDECNRSGREGFDVLLEEWGTSGRQRPTVEDLFSLLQKRELFRAVQFLRDRILKGDGNNGIEESERDHQNHVFGTFVIDEKDVQVLSPIEAINTENIDSADKSTMLVGAKGSSANPSHSLDTEVLKGMECSNVFHFSHSALRTVTNGFSEVLYSDGGNKLGEGAFGKVYFALLFHKGSEKKVAIKRLHPVHNTEFRVEHQFKTEVEVLSGCSHENLVPLVGFSMDGPEWCLVYSFMPSGSLQDCLSCINGKAPIDWKTRIQIGEGSARGIVHLHTFHERPLVHRDIKSANILLDENMTPKVGDFGLVKQGGAGQHTHTIVKTSAVFGTSAYMAPEAFRGDISVKMDTFSFGVVLLELLTGLPAHDENREEPDLLSYIMDAQESEDGIEMLVDTEAGDWDMNIFKSLLLFAGLCGESKKKRPDMVQALEKYSEIVHCLS